MSSLSRWMALAVTLLASPAMAAEEPLVMLVMDPMSLQLSCDCVKGYAQRKYDKLGEHLEKALSREVEVVWAESLAKGATEADGRSADLIIGKHSVVLVDAKKESWPAEPIASLTDKSGKTTQSGLVVVRKDDSAKTVGDLKGYRVLFGPADCDEKSTAPMALLRNAGVEVAKQPETAESCSIAATKLFELPADVQAAAVISSYAEPLLAGCGAIKQGDLRIVGESAPVPFITAFVKGTLPAGDRAAIREALLKVGEQADLLIALETAAGFVPYEAAPKVAAAKKK